MQTYQTVEEKSSEWNLSIRHIQYLCRKGKINGAIKRAGSWFIPENAENPAKNTKLNGNGFNFVGTKKLIFDKAIELFLLKGFDQVSIKDIANSVGIQQSTIYNHFKSKQEILDTIYRFYSYYYLEGRLDLKEIENKWDLQKHWTSEDIIQIIQSVQYNFKDKNKMADIIKIVFQRIGIDEHAREIAKTLMIDEGMGYVEKVFQSAIRSGKLAPFDTHTIALFINSIRMYMLVYWIVSPTLENIGKFYESEQALYKQAVEKIIAMDLDRGEL